MANRLYLHTIFEEILGSKNVYFQPPESKKMEYPAIKYSMDGIDKRSADDTAYMLTKKYELIVISKKPDHPVIDKLLQLPMCRLDTHYISDNLNHDVFTLYY